jgi:hypothetical protein
MLRLYSIFIKQKTFVLERLKTTLLLVLLLSSYPLIYAQNKDSKQEFNTLLSSNPETLFLHCNTTTFVTGETLLYKLYCLNPTVFETSTVSQIAYVALIGEDSKRIYIQKILLENGIGQGDFFVPTTLKTGSYKLVAYTQWILNKPITTLFQLDVSIINPYLKTENIAQNITKDLPSLKKGNPINSDNQTTETAAEENLFALQLDKKKVAKREKFILKINTVAQQIQKGNYSISVRKTDQLATEKQPTATEFKSKWLKKTNNNQTPEKEIIVPELRGEIITGSITAKNGSSSLLNKTIALSIPGKSYTFKTTNTNASGKFIFNLDKTNYGSNLVLQIINEDRENYTIQLDQPKDFDSSLLHYKSNFELSPDMQNSILERSVASQIENAYHYKKTDSLVVSNATDDFFKSIAKEYILDDYTRFPSLQETITEVLFEAYYKQTENDYSIGVRDFNDNYEIPGSPLVLVDGLLLQDYKELFKYNTKNIYKVSIITGGYYYGSRLFNGVISFTTFKQDFISKQSGTYILDTTFLRPAVKKEYFSPDYADKSKNKRIPDQRYQLLWLPQVTLANTENPISFYTSDVTGTFEITLEGFTYQGIPVSLKDTFEVQ